MKFILDDQNENVYVLHILNILLFVHRLLIISSVSIPFNQPVEYVSDIKPTTSWSK